MTTTLHVDMDGDMFGNPFAPTTTGCPRPGYADNPRDCDDGNGSVNPATSEVCNMIDDNCDGRADEGVEPRVFYADCDGDTYGSATRTMTSCTTIVGRPAGCLDVAAMWTSTGGDCDDVRRATYPGAPETCNAIDDDCSGTADDMGAEAWCSTPEGLAGLPNTATGTCRSGACAVATCTAPYLDCSAGAGCETDSQTDASNCGRCGMVCPLGCMAGMCRTGYAEIALGWSHSCGRLGREVQCWGSNARGQLGDGTTMNRLRRTLVMGVTDATQITGGGQHTCALLSTGRVQCWGHNFFGQLGDGSFSDRAFALPPVMGLTDAIEVGAGDWHTCALRSGGGVACWGTSNGGRLGDGPHPAGYARSMAGPVTGLTDAIDLGVGMRHSCAVRRDGSIVCWGTNDSGQLGDRTRSDRDVPVAVMGITNAVAVAPGHGHTCALLADRTVQCWGFNNYGQLGDGSTTTRDVPAPVIGVDDAVAIASGNNRTCVIRVGGGMWCWGENVFGGIGDGTTANRPLRVAPVGITSAVRVGIGDLHTCALTSDGRTQCWGRNSVGQLGDDTTVDHTTPAPIIPP